MVRYLAFGLLTLGLWPVWSAFLGENFRPHQADWLMIGLWMTPFLPPAFLLLRRRDSLALAWLMATTPALLLLWFAVLEQEPPRGVAWLFLGPLVAVALLGPFGILCAYVARRVRIRALHRQS